MDLELSGKHVVVLGGQGSIGAAICKVLREEGTHPIPLDLKDPDPVDLSALEAVAERFSRLKNELERIHGVVASVYGGPIAQCAPHDLRLADFQEDQRHTLYAALVPTLEAIRWMRSTGGGNIVIISSINAHQGLGQLGYDMAKAALEQLIRDLATSYEQEHIYAFTYAPGTVAPTPVWDNPEGQEALAVIREEIPDRQITTPEEVAKITAFLLSPIARSLVGYPILGDRAWSLNKVRGGFKPPGNA